MLGQYLAAQGIVTLVLDLYGTGDSEGDFSEARWSIWLDDMDCGVEWLVDRGFKTISILGIRLGAVLASELLKNSKHHFDSALFWQPVHDGKSMMSQFLRIRLASELNTHSDIAVRELLDAGEEVEVAGYQLSAALYNDIVNTELRLDAIKSPLSWIEITPNSDMGLSRSTQKLLNNNAKQMEVNAKVVDAPQFWSLFDANIEHALFSETASALIKSGR